MKKAVMVSAVLLAVLCALPLVAAPRQELAIIANVRPTITVAFDEPVVVRSATFFSENFSVRVNATSLMANASVVQFTPMRALANSVYTFTAEVSDLVGNTFTHTQQFAVAVPSTAIQMVAPRLGYAQQSPFPITIRTSFESAPEPTQCKYTFTDPLFDFLNFGLLPFDVVGTSTEHTKAAFTGPQANFILPTPFFVLCTDSRERVSQQQFNLFWDTIDPTIETIALDPSTINERSEGGRFATLLTVTASEPVVCKYALTSTDYAQMTPFASYRTDDVGAFQKTANQSVTEFNPQVNTADYTLAIGCEDRAGRQTVVETRGIRVDTTEALTIAVLSPPQFPTESSIELKLRTNKKAHCLYAEAPNQPSSAMSPAADQPPARQHSAALGRVDEGAHTYNVLCASTAAGTQQIAEQAVSFTIDRTPPGRPEISGPSITCQQTGFVFPDGQQIMFSANDSSSGISHYLFSLKFGSEWLINDSRSGGSIASITARDNGAALNLSRQSYTLSVKAVDNAGKQSAAATFTLKYDPELPICREHNPPVVTLLKNQVGNGVNVSIVCRDDTACDNSSFMVDHDAEQESCKPSSRLFPPFTQTLYSTAFFCYNVSDVNANSVAGGEFITVSANTSTNSTCANRRKDGDETDVDCGGSCVPCEDSKRCGDAEDCQSAYCSSGICEQASCSDGIKNGEEKGVDCGGNCPTGCEIGSICVFSSECTTSYCDPATRTCAAPSCSDGLKNGKETGKDCGGDCDPCGEGEVCKEDSDCASGKCSFGFCTGGGTGAGEKDTDGDGIPDDKEKELGLDPNDPSDAEADPDNDGLTNLEEVRYRTDIHNPDTDGDGFTDGEEVEAGTDPLDPNDKPAKKGLGILKLLPLLIGILLIGYGLWALAYNRYVLQPSKLRGAAPTTPIFRAPGAEPMQRRMAQEREQRLAEAQRKMREASQGKLRERLKIFDLFGPEAKPGAPEKPQAEEEIPSANVLEQLPSPPAVEERAGWVTVGKKPDGRAEETFRALEELGSRVPKEKPDALGALRASRKRPAARKGKKKARR